MTWLDIDPDKIPAQPAWHNNRMAKHVHADYVWGVSPSEHKFYVNDNAAPFVPEKPGKHRECTCGLPRDLSGCRDPACCHPSWRDCPHHQMYRTLDTKD